MGGADLPATDDLSCRELVELVTDYLEGSLCREEAARFERHLAACRGCDAYLAQMRQTIRLLGELPPAAVPEEAMARLLAAFRGWKQG